MRNDKEAISQNSCIWKHLQRKMAWPLASLGLALVGLLCSSHSPHTLWLNEAVSARASAIKLVQLATRYLV